MIPSEAIYDTVIGNTWYQDVLLEEWSVGDCPGFEAEAIFYDCGGSLRRRANQASGPVSKGSSSWELGSWGRGKPGDAHGEKDLVCFGVS